VHIAYTIDAGRPIKKSVNAVSTVFDEIAKANFYWGVSYIPITD